MPVVELAKWSTVPVVNGLSDYSHPCQAMADAMTIQEKFGKRKGLNVTYVGDGNNVALSRVPVPASRITSIRVPAGTIASKRAPTASTSSSR